MSIFNTIKGSKPKRSAFNLSHNYKMTGEMGVLYPIFCQDVVPGDTFKLNTEIFMRMLPMIAPLMSRVRIYTHYFFVPKRLLWNGWKEFITGASQSKSRKDIDDFVPPSYPRFALPITSIFDFTESGKPPVVTDDAKSIGSRFITSSLADYLNFPVFDSKNVDNRAFSGQVLSLDALPFRAYQLIWNEYYRDENLQDEVDILFQEDGVLPFNHNTLGPIQQLMSLRRRAWKKDYFTAALPFAQAGPDVTLPLTGLHDDEFQLYADFLPGFMPGGTKITQKLLNVENGAPEEGNYGLNAHEAQMRNDNSMHYLLDDLPRDDNGTPAIGIENSQLKKMFSNIGSATINELRRAFAAQRFLEASARGGSRYIEQLYSIFGVRSSDARLQRPEYLGGGVQDVVVSDVLQTSATDQTSPQANQAGVGGSIGRTASFKRWFEEHGYVIGIMSILPDASYQQGMPRQYMKFDRYDHYWPQFANLGEQDVRPSELYYSPGDSLTYDDEIAFGYNPRYSEYKYIPSTVHGDFRENLKFWHLGRIFDERPGLNGDFIEAKPRNDVFAVTEEKTHHFLFNIQHHLRAIRPMPYYGTPHL